MRFDRITRTANGTTRFALVTLRQIQIGQLSVDNVPAAVIESLGSGANSQHEQTFLLWRAEFRPEAPRSRLQVQFDLERREVAV